MQRISLFFALLLAIFTGGCASVMNGTTQLVAFQSEPTDAKTTLLDQNSNPILVQQTPFTTLLKRIEKYSVKMEKDGYEPYEGEIKKEFNSATAGNLLAGGAIGLVIDQANGANQQFPEEIKVELAPVGSGKASFQLPPVEKAEDEAARAARDRERRMAIEREFRRR